MKELLERAVKAFPEQKIDIISLYNNKIRENAYKVTLKTLFDPGLKEALGFSVYG